MTALKKLNKELKKNKKLNEYKTMFAHKQMVFACSKVALIFNEDVSVDVLYKMEVKLIGVKKDINMFKEAMKDLTKITNKNIKWDVFAEFLWYLYQTSTYYKDTKKGIKNIFNDDTFIKLNSLKRNAYQRWIDSLDKTDAQYNVRIRKVIKELT
ncbi:MAG: hypothetical protein KAG04_00660 [Mycoplasmataceae bacterium]|nr:hypothetical protein [Mycoplasmataceae bacterium]